MKRAISRFLIVLLFAAALGCVPLPTNIIVGSGDVVTQIFGVSDFDRVALEGFGSVFIEQGQTESLSVQTDDNIMPLLAIHVQGRELRLGIKTGYSVNPSDSITFNVKVKELNAVRLDGSGTIDIGPIQSGRMGVSLQGSGDIEIRGLKADDLSIDLNGSGNITIDDISVQSTDTSLQGSGDIKLRGKAETQKVTVNGSGTYQAGDLETSRTDVSIPGSANVTVWVREQLTARVNGSGDIRYYGQPGIDQSGSGSGNLISLGKK